MINRLLNPRKIKPITKHLKYSFSQNINFNPYTVLGISKTATDKEIKKAYVKKVKESHPDVKKDDGKAFKQVQKSYEILRDSQKRREYDMGSTGGGFGGQQRQGGYQNTHGGFGGGARGQQSYQYNFRSVSLNF